MTNKDEYVHEMDWGEGVDNPSEVIWPNYRKYQYNLIKNCIGKNVLEVGSGDRGFTNQIVKNSNNLERLLSIEPSSRLLELYKDTYSFPKSVSFENLDLFDLSPEKHGKFDTIIMVHVLEHIEKDNSAIEHLYNMLSNNGYLLIIVPALQKLYSVHDKKLGHFRRYNKKQIKKIVNLEKYKLEKLWYQDFIGVLGSLYYFKLKRTKLKSEQGQQLISKQGLIYDKYIIPTQEKIERFIKLPLGLSLTCILKKK
jgi:2-polyprenyl-3-methyl-5-hydroxy-6-metoxy-1,4-benzoquinol methylase